MLSAFRSFIIVFYKELVSSFRLKINRFIKGTRITFRIKRVSNSALILLVDIIHLLNIVHDPLPESFDLNKF